MTTTEVPISEIDPATPRRLEVVQGLEIADFVGQQVLVDTVVTHFRSPLRSLSGSLIVKLSRPATLSGEETQLEEVARGNVVFPFSCPWLDQELTAVVPLDRVTIWALPGTK